jgi:hypothetical protein
MNFLVKSHFSPIDNGLIPFDIYRDGEYIGSVYGPRGAEICYAFIKASLGEQLLEHDWLREFFDRFCQKED